MRPTHDLQERVVERLHAHGQSGESRGHPLLEARRADVLRVRLEGDLRPGLDREGRTERVEGARQLRGCQEGWRAAAVVHRVGRTTLERRLDSGDLVAQRVEIGPRVATARRHQVEIAVGAAHRAVRDVHVQADHTFSTDPIGTHPLIAFGRLT